MGKYIVALDQGTTSSRAILYNKEAETLSVAQKEFTQLFPSPGWVEHDPIEIWESQLEVLYECLEKTGAKLSEVTAVGITNQRETSLIWDRDTGEPVYNAIVWQDKRTSELCEELNTTELKEQVHDRTGLVIDSYFSATKIMWLLENVEGLRSRAEKGELAFGTVDSWLIWNLTKGKKHVTDYTNASRSMVFNIHKLEWDQYLLDKLEIPASLLPEVLPSAGTFGSFIMDNIEIPITGVAGDQQAALFGQQCFEPGMVKNTYGTGCFMLMNTGQTPYISKNGLLTTLACGIDGNVNYALEGSIFIAGAAVQWLRDSLRILEHASESESLAQSVIDSHGVYVVPAFAGLGAPYWDQSARGAIFGLTRDTGREHIVKATLESLGYQTRDVLEAMEKDAGIPLATLKVDGGATANDFLLQFQSDILGKSVERPENTETTALGAAYLAGLASGFWTEENLHKIQKIDKTFSPTINENERTQLYKGWKNAVKRTMNWTREING